MSLTKTSHYSESPDEWLEVVETRPVVQINGLVRMFSRVGVGIELSASPSKASSAPATSVHLVFREARHSSRFEEQLNQVLLENVRSRPLPVSDASADEEKLLTDQLHKAVADGSDGTIRLFLLAYVDTGNFTPLMEGHHVKLN